MYAVKVFVNVGIIRMPPDGLITFRDRSNDFSLSSTSHEQKRDIPLPNPRYLAIHAAVAEILHMSAAGQFFDDLLKKFKDSEDEDHSVKYWSDLERLMEEDALRDSVELMHLVGRLH